MKLLHNKSINSTEIEKVRPQLRIQWRCKNHIQTICMINISHKEQSDFLKDCIYHMRVSITIALNYYL